MVKSAKGKEVDIEALRNANGDSVALGNASMNARGDLLGKNGKIIKTRDELAREYHDVPTSRTVKNVSISKTNEEIAKKQKEEREAVKQKQTSSQKTPSKQQATKKQEEKTDHKEDKTDHKEE